MRSLLTTRSLLNARIVGITKLRSQEGLMSQDMEQTIRERAYHLWVADGCRDGESEHHWLAAERDILAAFAATAPAPKGRSRRTGGATNDAGAKPPAKARRRA